jgi:hypothetical protein
MAEVRPKDGGERVGKNGVVATGCLCAESMLSWPRGLDVIYCRIHFICFASIAARPVSSGRSCSDLPEGEPKEHWDTYCAVLAIAACALFAYG